MPKWWIEPVFWVTLCVCLLFGTGVIYAQVPIAGPGLDIQSGANGLGGGGIQANLEGTPKNVKYRTRMKPIALDGNDESAANYCRADPTGVNNHSTCYYMEVTDEQQDTEAGAFKIIHYGEGDAFYIAAFNNGPMLETASFYNGSRGLISTVQREMPGSGTTFGNSTLFNGVWGDDGTGGATTPPNFGMFYASLSLGEAFAVRLQDPGATGFAWGRPEFSIREYSLSRYRARIYNTGQMTLESTAATAGAPLQAAPLVELRGSHWNGASADDKDIQFQSTMDGGGNPYLLLQMGAAGAEVTTATFWTDGDFNASGAVQPGAYTSDPCGDRPNLSLWFNSTAGVPCYCDGSGVDKKVSDDSACF